MVYNFATEKSLSKINTKISTTSYFLVNLLILAG